jgi:hypothetical protein
VQLPDEQSMREHVLRERLGRSSAKKSDGPRQTGRRCRSRCGSSPPPA